MWLLWQPFPIPAGRRAQAWRHEPAFRRPAHFHAEPEINLMARGTATFVVGEQRVPMLVGSLVGYPPGVDHYLECTSEDLELYVAGFQPALLAAFARERGSTLRFARPPTASTSAPSALAARRSGRRRPARTTELSSGSCSGCSRGWPNCGPCRAWDIELWHCSRRRRRSGARSLDFSNHTRKAAASLPQPLARTFRLARRRPPEAGPRDELTDSEAAAASRPPPRKNELRRRESTWVRDLRRSSRRGTATLPESARERDRRARPQTMGCGAPDPAPPAT